MLNFYVKIIVIVLILNKPLQTTAQLSFPWHEAGLISGMSGYIGDINPDKYLKFNNALIGLTYKYNFNHRNSVRINLIHTKIQADDKQSNNEWQKRRNLNFFSPLTEISVAYELNFFEYSPTIYQGLFITPYINLGIGAFKFDPQTYLNGKIYHLRDYGTEGQGQKNDKEKPIKKYSLYNVSIPFSLGLKFNLSKKINIFSELSYKFTLTDYLDDISTNYARIPTDSVQGQIGAALADRSPELGYDRNIFGSQRGDSSKKDTYMFVIIGITINFGIPECLGPL